MKEILSLRVVETAEGDVECDINPPNPPGYQLDALIQVIAQQRKEALPPVPEEIPFAMNDVPVAALGNWFVGETFEHGEVLGLRHQALGWVVFALPASFPDELAAKLQELEQRRKASRPSTSQ